MEKLKILLVANGFMTNVLGVLKVHYELKEEYEKQGHQVDVLDFSKIYAKKQSALHRIFGELYTVRFWQFLKKHAHQYDVIDANIECVVYPKESFNFNGVLLARSHGIKPLYSQSEQNIERYKLALIEERSNFGLKTKIGNFYRSLQKETGLKELFASVKYADIVHCLNSEEYKYFTNNGVPENKLKLIPNGLPDQFIHTFNQLDVSDRRNDLCFIGSWTIRKGINDLNEILAQVNKAVEINNLILLGGFYPEVYVRKYFDTRQQKYLRITPEFAPEKLSSYVNTCKVGIFPSYAEGFGLAVIEQLACGIPVVAYNVPGPADILQLLDPSLLIEPGNLDGFSKKVIEILSLREEEYQDLCERCKKESQKYLLSKVSQQFLTAYESYLQKDLLQS